MSLISKSLDTLNEVIFIMDKDYTIESVKYNHNLLSNSNLDEIVGEKCYKALLGKNSPCNDCPLRNENFKKDDGVHEILHKVNGKTISVKLIPQANKNGEVEKIINIFTDITHKDDIKSKLRISEIRLEEASKIAKLGHWDYDIVNNNIYWSNEVHEIFGNESKKKKFSFQDFLNLVHHEDREFVKTTYLNSLETREPYEIEHRIKLENGEVRYLNEKCKTFYNSYGKPYRSIGTVIDVTDKKLAEIELRNSEKKYKKLFQGSRDGIVFINESGEFVNFNNSFQHMLRYEKEELLAMNFLELTPQGDHDWDKEEQISVQLHNYGVSETFEKTLIKKDGTAFSVEVTIYSFEAGEEKMTGAKYWAVVKDITERKNAEKSLRESKHQLSQIFNNAPFSMMLVNPKGEVVKINKTGLKLIEKTEKDIIGFQPGEVLKCVQAIEDNAGCGKGKYCHSCIIRNNIVKTFTEKTNFNNVTVPFQTVKNGEVKNLIFNVSTSYIKSDSDPYLLLCMDDITEKEESKKLQEELEVTKRATKMKQSFLANMSHEIRTPMTGIIGLVDLLIDSPLDETQLDYLKTIKNSSNSLLNILNDILLLSKIEASKLEIIPDTVSIKSIVNELDLLFDSMLRNKGLELFFNIPDNFPQHLYLDSNRLKQILTNLLSNAIKFTDEGSITVNFNLEEQKGDNLNLKIEVIDTGIGIDEEERKNLFESFTQVDSSYSRNQHGIGLGLSICKNLVHLMKGSINVESEVGKGSNFHFTIEAKVGAKNESNLKKSANSSMEKDLELNILVAEDVSVNQKVIQLMLKHFGCKSTIAQNGKEAVEKALENNFEIILMDIQMPIMNGIEAMKEIRKLHENPPPIIGLSANSMVGDAEKFIAEGLDDYLTKPINKELLYVKLKQWSTVKKTNSKLIKMPNALAPTMTRIAQNF